ncbi:MAG TPA: undecaprenyl-phosphate glucose phosphotransferase [Usitatibacter sp.]|jgi:putative colanic acid biosynthesis UDP-glucose lipid carrier transferase|nr:undecaprenyl-phosphate glucose phosphotransferase [Usitatibacter sp.]
MIASQDSTPRLGQGPLAPAALIRMLLEALVSVGMLAACAAFFGTRFDGPYVILALLVFSLTFPGRAPHGTSVGAIAREVLAGWVLVVGLLLMLGWATRTIGSFDPRVMAAWIALTPVALFAVHVATPLVLPRLLATEGFQRVAVIAGAGSLGRKLAERIAATPFAGIRVAGYFDDRGTGRLGSLDAAPVLGSLEQLPEYAKKHRVDLIYVTLPMASQPRIMKLLDGLHDTTASVYFTPDIFIFDLIQGRMDSIGGMPVLAVCETPFSGMNGVVKRASDIVLATLILLLISPLLAAIAIGVKMTSPGPALFRQRRYGLDGREIVVYKFRSMTVAEDGAVVRQATRNDSRVTPFGAFMRRTSLDELPQFINVLQGRMSIVGPRPHAVAHNEMYRKLIKSYMIRHKVRPGITGWAQVNGLRGETETVEKMKARIEYDLDYLRNWSLRLDLAIIWKTIFVVFRKPETAY